MAGTFGLAGLAGADTIFKSNNTLPLNDPLSWESGVVPGASDVAVFDERVTTNTLSFLLTNNLAWAGVVFTNQTTAVPNMVGTVTFATNGAHAASLALGTNGVCLAGSGLGLTLNLSLALSDVQTWQVDRRNLTFNSPVSGTSDWTLNLSSQVVWNVAAGYSGNLIVTNSSYVTRFCATGQLAKAFTQKWGGRTEMTFTNSTLWSNLFLNRTATIYGWSGLTAGGTLQFETGDSFYFPNSGGRFTLDSGYVVQNGGTLSGYELQTQYSTYDARYTMNGGSLALASGLLFGNGAQYVNGESRFLQKGGTVTANVVKEGWASCKYLGLNTYEMTGGVFQITGTRGADTGVHLSWNDSGNSPENSGAFLMEGGWADIDQIALGRSQDGALYATTNAFSLFKMTGGELVLGSRGLYASRSWNNGITNSGYAVKLQGGTLTAGDSWSSQLDVFLSDSNGGTAFNTADTNGVGQRVVLNGAVYGPGSLTKSGNGTLVLAGEAAYAGKTTVKAGTLMVGGTSSASDCYRWTADSLSGTNYAPVMTWTDLNNGVPATNVVVSQSPLLIRNELNGHSVVRFTSASTQYLAVPADRSPISTATNFSILVVFKTGTAGAGGVGYWYGNTGLVDAEQPGIVNDWGLAYNSAGQVCGGAGFPANNKDVTAYSSSANSVVDNQSHVAIFTWQGTNLTLNVDGRITNAVSTASTVSARNSYRILFGSLALQGGDYFNGDMSEIRMYRNRVLTADEQNRIGNELSATYGVPGAVFAEPASVASVAGEVASASSFGAVSPLAYDAGVWDADKLTGTNGSSVTSWASTNGTRTATTADAVYLEGMGNIGGAAPTLAVSAINGHNAVHFTGSARSALGISTANNPLAGVTNFSVAIVFRTANGYGPNSVNRQWWECTGLIDTEEPGTTNDWGLALTYNGRVAAGIGGGDATVYSRPFDLGDGAAHVAVVSYNAAGGYTAVMADGLYITQGAGTHATPRNVKRLLLGSINGQGGQFLTGDLAAFRLYPERALTMDEMTSVSTELASKYAIRFVSRSNVLAPQPTGLGGGDVQVSSGASLVLQTATNSAVTLGSGQTIYGGGTVRGTLALNSGATVDIGLSEALTMDALWLNAGATVRWHHSGSAGNTMSVESLKTSGTVAVRVEGGTDLPVRVSLIAYTAGNNLSSATWTVSGGKNNTRIEVNAAARTIDLVTPKGTMVVVR